MKKQTKDQQIRYWRKEAREWKQAAETWKTSFNDLVANISKRLGLDERTKQKTKKS